MNDLPIEERVVGVLTGTYPEVLPRRAKSGWGPSWSYEELAGLLGEVIGSEDTGDYQGTTYFLLRRGDRWGFLAQDYGSCSGCDWLEGCSTYEDHAELFEAMKKSVTWHATPAEIAAYMRREMAPQHSWYGTDYTALVDKFVALLPLQLAAVDDTTVPSGDESAP